MAVFNGVTIIPMPSTPPAPKHIEWSFENIVGRIVSPFTGQEQVQNWQASWPEASLSYPPMKNATFQPWAAFLMALQGAANILQFGDPLMTAPRGTGSGTPVVNGAGQTGYSISTRGWTASANGVLLPGDYLQIGFRLYRYVGTVPLNANGSGVAIAAIWPNIRESPLDGTAISLNNTQGVWRMKNNAPKWAVSPGGIYLVTFEIKEFI